jgi:hypothetical protein
MVAIAIFAGLVATGAIFATFKNIGNGSQSQLTKLDFS